MMQKQLASSNPSLAEPSNRSLTSEERRLKRKIPYKIEICNQDLEEAIREVRAHVRDNPEWRLNVKAVQSQYPPSKERKIVNDSQRLDALQKQLPASQKLVFPATAEPPKSNFQKLKFTERKQKEFEERNKEIKERRMQLEVSLLEKQMKAKLERKIQENLRLKEKRRLMQEIEQNREDSLRHHNLEHSRRRLESSLLHESSIANAKMMRKSRTRSQRQFLNEQKSRSDETVQALHFKEIQMSKSKYEDREIILSRYRTMRSNSQGSLGRRSIHNIQPKLIPQ